MSVKVPNGGLHSSMSNLTSGQVSFLVHCQHINLSQASLFIISLAFDGPSYIAKGGERMPLYGVMLEQRSKWVV